MKTPATISLRVNKSSIMVWVALLLVLILAISGAAAIYSVYSENKSRVAQQLADEARLAHQNVNAFFLHGLAFVELTKTIPALQQYFKSLTDKQLYTTNPWYAELYDVIDTVQEASKGQFINTWVCDLDTDVAFQSNSSPWEAPLNWVAASRPWYTTAMRLKRPFVTSPYIEASSGMYVVSIVTPITDKDTDEVLGVFGADLSIPTIVSLVRDACPATQDHLVFIAPDGTIVYHANKQFQERKICNLPYSQNITEAVLAARPGTYSFTRDGVPMQGYLSVIEGTDWLLLSELEQSYIDGLMANATTFLGVCFLVGLLLLAGCILLVRKLLRSLAKKEFFLEHEVERRTRNLVKQDSMLLTVNEVAKKLLTSSNGQTFDSMVNECLHMVGEATGKNRVYIWKDQLTTEGFLACIKVYAWVRATNPAQQFPLLEKINYDQLPSFRNTLDKGECLNSLTCNLSESEKKLLEPEHILSLLVAPIVIDGVRWGFIGLANCETMELYTDLEETMLRTSGFMLASAILKQNTETRLREADELTQTLLDTVPLACNMWNEDLEPVASNEGVAKLFGLEPHEVFCQHFYEFSPPEQPDGRLSSELAIERFATAFATGQCAFEWMYQDSEGNPIPVHVTLVRLKFKNSTMVASYVRDLRELKAQEAQRYEAEERTHLMFNAMPMCCNFWDKNFNNLDCNGAAARLFELESKQEYLARFTELSPPFQPDGRPSDVVALEKVAQAFQDGYARFEWLHQKLDGTPVPCEITLVRILYKGEYTVLGYTQDMRELKAMLSEVRHVQEKLALARDEALAHSRAKSDFLAKMSHEIRTPMNAIVGMSELILREGIPQHAREHALAIKQAGAHLLSIINDILDFSKIESGKLEINPSEYLFGSLINDTINIIRVRMVEKPIAFAVNIDPTLPNHLIGDDIRIRQILLNVLTNAVKYTEEGFITLTVEGEKIDATTLRLCMKVSDSGIGIREEDLSSLFAQFVQFDTSRNKGVEGTGLGLAITRSLCCAMGGDIEVSSVYSKGSVFTVTLLQQYIGTDCIALVENPESKRVLLYEPRKIIANSILQSLDAFHIPATLVINQSELYEQLNTQEYDFIFMSYFLFETVKSILVQMRCMKNVIVMTEHGEVIGNHDIKTVTMPVYALTLANILNDTWDTQNMESDVHIRFTAPRARVLIVDDISINLKVAEGLMAPYGMTIDLCENGADAVEMVQKNQYDIIFMDHMMPGMNGIEATLAIRELPEAKQIPIIALTANAIPSMLEVFLSNGFTEFLAKPIEISKLNAQLERFIPKDKQEKYTAPLTQETPDTLTFAIEGVSTEQGLALTGGSIENYLRALRSYHKDGLSRIPVLRTALADDDLLLYATHVHALKSASASIGAGPLSELARQLEMAAKQNDRTFLQQQTEDFLKAFRTLIDSIGYTVTAYNEDTPHDVMTDEQVTTALLELKISLEQLDAMTADTLLNTLQTRTQGTSVAVHIEQIAQHVLLGEYDEAIAAITTLLPADIPPSL